MQCSKCGNPKVIIKKEQRTKQSNILNFFIFSPPILVNYIILLS